MSQAVKITVLISLFFYISAQTSLADIESENFNATWQLMDNSSKEQFLSGYLYAWEDVVGILNVVEEYARKNPEGVLEAVKKIKAIYNFRGLNRSQLKSEIDNFYSDPRNTASNLPKAITAVRIQESSK